MAAMKIIMSCDNIISSLSRMAQNLVSGGQHCCSSSGFSQVASKESMMWSVVVLSCFQWLPWLINILGLGKCAYIKQLSITIAEIHSQPTIVIDAHLSWRAMYIVLLCFHKGGFCGVFTWSFLQESNRSRLKQTGEEVVWLKNDWERFL